MNILITGATGFIGQRLVQGLLKQSTHRLSALTRRRNSSLPEGVHPILINTIDGESDYAASLDGIDVVIHLAARVHKMDDTGDASYPAYKATNVDGTLRLARQAAMAGVKRFIYLSSIKVNGEFTRPGAPFKADDPPHPTDPYAVSKYEAERALMLLTQETALEFVIIRPPLVYGPGVKANFQKLMEIVRRGIPLPLGAIKNRRSLVSIDNLVSLIQHCIDHTAAKNQIFLVSDDQDLSTTELLRRIAASMNRSVFLIPFPTSLLQLIARLLGKEEVTKRLLGDLQVDVTKTKNLLEWQPVTTLEESLRDTANNYLQQHK
ncbi:MAG: SDR family oxidoreductase [Candidatus Thiodiazotropha sp. (ex Monitilora ramsayi)]|nr:SDR family oxidoreductase [Candidatus Thiodiazotropha sp. (ex Monitilora ramsayi)]